MTKNFEQQPGTVAEPSSAQFVPGANRLMMAYGVSLAVLALAISMSYVILGDLMSTQRALSQASSHINDIKLAVTDSVGVLSDLNVEKKKSQVNTRLTSLITTRAVNTKEEIASKRAALLATRGLLEPTSVWPEVRVILDEDSSVLLGQLDSYIYQMSVMIGAGSEDQDGAPHIPVEAAGARYGSLFQRLEKASDLVDQLVDAGSSRVVMMHRGLTALVILVMVLVSTLVVAPLWFKLLEEHKRLQKAHTKLFRIAYTDRETGLPNLAGLERGHAASIADGNDLYIFVVRITNLDEISNLISSHRVRAMLLLMSARLHHADIVSHQWARSGEAEFCCLLSKETVDDAGEWAESLHATLVETLAVDGIVVRPEVSMAVAGIGMPDDPGAPLLWEHQSNARLALHQFAPPACWLPHYDPDLKNSLKTRNDLINQISDGLRHAEFIPYYQIKVHAESGLPSSIEVLARWLLPDNSVVSPGVFIPAAESSGQIIELTYSIFDQVLKDIRHWCDLGYPVGRVALNVAGDVLHHEELIPRLTEMSSSLPQLCEGLEIEITENIALGDDKEKTDTLLQQIRDLGAEVAIDDFGTGYASLQSLVDLPFDVLKVDRSFVLPMTEKGDGQELVSAMIRLSGELNKRCVVEGIETEWQWKMLADLGADELQGFYFHKPGPANEVQKVLQASYGWMKAA